RRERHDLHVVPVAQLAGHRAEDARAPRVALVVDEHGRVLVEADVAAVGPAELLRRADDHGLDDVTLLDRGVGDGGLDARDDDVTDAGSRLRGAAHHADALDRPGPSVVGHLEAGLGLDHAAPSSPAGSVAAAFPVAGSSVPAAPAASSASCLPRPGWA